MNHRLNYRRNFQVATLVHPEFSRRASPGPVIYSRDALEICDSPEPVLVSLQGKTKMCCFLVVVSSFLGTKTVLRFLLELDH